ncbi:MAG TPA: AAA family ATPase [Anaerohalosphaeraceae bacterium]|nr:AAA family ATPase [Anaerohalosphaeraceae bacterium]HQG05083.1 AAA family ATPase [Anaerohalosphaeraceae bacterium]HQI06256.1 AAA family ATPase [Anaerohalosphaeraceae bacterium]HQJ67124.1 AAA family ATPase [Anaerohalosphaeraceae bacterium]
MKPLFIGATLRDCGKTSVCLGLMQLLQERGLNPGYCKPVGQHYVRYQDKNIDEDGVLMHQVFHIKDEPYYLSPIAIERGFTKRFIDNPDVRPLEEQILSVHYKLRQWHPMLIYEGTGHAGVGSCFGLSNARVAQLLGAKVVIVTEGGIGRPLDEIAVSLALFADYEVEVVGAILNKILPEKYDKICETAAKGLRLLGTELVGAMPYEPALSEFTVGQVAEEFGYKVFCGSESLNNRINHVIIAAMEPQHVFQHIEDRTLVIIPGDRVDNILITILLLSRYGEKTGGMILTSGFEPHPTIEPLLQASQIPVLLSTDDTFTVSARMKDLGFKIRPYETDKIIRLHQIVRDYVDTDRILDALKE